MSEPKRVTAGLSWAWSATFPGYSGADGWSIKYHFWPADGTGDAIEIDAVAGAGNAWSVSRTAAQTANYAPGRYSWRAIASNGAETKDQAATGSMQILPDPTGTPVDGRSHAEIVLEAIEAVIERRASSSQKKLDIEGQSLEHMTHAELVKLRQQYSLEVDRIRQAKQLAKGGGFGGKIATRF